jgi:hypothetical protein
MGVWLPLSFGYLDYSLKQFFGLIKSLISMQPFLRPLMYFLEKLQDL